MSSINWVYRIGLIGVLFLLGACSESQVVEQGVVLPTATAVPPTTPSPSLLPPSTTQSATATAVSPTSPPQPTNTPLPTLTPTPPTWDNPAAASFAQTANDWKADFLTLDQTNTGTWQFDPQMFIHPIAFAVQGETAYLLDGGRVLRLDLSQPSLPQVVLQPGEHIAGVRVQEPLDLAFAPDGLLVLDRTSDVYRFDGAIWSVDRYDRPIRDTSSHYYVALDGDTMTANGRYLLENEYNYVINYSGDQQLALWPLPEARAVDVSASGPDVYVLSNEMDSTAGQVRLYHDTSLIDAFRSRVTIDRPRQLVATETAVYVLDQAGQRLLALDRANGNLQRIYQLPPDVSAFWADQTGAQLIFAGRDRLYFWPQPERFASISGGDPLVGIQPHDPHSWDQFTDYQLPVGINLSPRDLQMPGAPRHYRLGIHAGADLYWAPGTAVYAAAAGTVIRSNHDFINPSPAQFDAWRAQINQLGYTPADLLDQYRGMQVWLEHEQGAVSRYVHLSSIDWTLVEDVPVAQGEFIGTVGNTGSPASIISEEEDAHLHFELRLGEHYLGQYLRPIETREWLSRLFGLE